MSQTPKKAIDWKEFEVVEIKNATELPSLDQKKIFVYQDEASKLWVVRKQGYGFFYLPEKYKALNKKISLEKRKAKVEKQIEALPKE